jgi:hypothetical protein
MEDTVMRFIIDTEKGRIIVPKNFFVQLDKMNKEEMTTEMYTGYEELFLYPITLAIILLFMDLIIVAVADSRNRKEK